LKQSQEQSKFYDNNNNSCGQNRAFQIWENNKTDVARAAQWDEHISVVRGSER